MGAGRVICGLVLRALFFGEVGYGQALCMIDVSCWLRSAVGYAGLHSTADLCVFFGP